MPAPKFRFSCHEPAQRPLRVHLSQAELAAVMLFHLRQRKRLARVAGELATGDHPHHTPQQIGDALEQCQTQRAAHQARAFELQHFLKSTPAQSAPNN